MFKTLKKISPGFLRTLARSIRKKLYNLSDTAKPYLISRTYCGFRLYYTNGAGLVNRIRIGNTDSIYEKSLVEAITKELGGISIPVFLDIGTNIGLISLSLIKAVPNIQIIGFEPSPIPYKSFFTTIFANKLDRQIQLYNKALSDTSGMVNFSVHSDRDSSGDGLFDTGRAETIGQYISIESTTLDELWKNVPIPNASVIKIDTEGSELKVIRGAAKYIKQNRPTIFLEISKENLAVYPYDEKDLVIFFAQNDYQLFDLHGTLISTKTISHAVLNQDTFIARPKK
jgi:FkbM family methyltransferase